MPPHAAARRRSSSTFANWDSRTRAGPKAYRIGIDPKDETTAQVSTENLKMSEPVAAAMSADVERWSRGVQGCKGSNTAMGWGMGHAAPAAPAIKTKPPAPAKPAKKVPAPATPKP